jgi:hypothetical protein
MSSPLWRIKIVVSNQKRPHLRPAVSTIIKTLNESYLSTNASEPAWNWWLRKLSPHILRIDDAWKMKKNNEYFEKFLVTKTKPRFQNKFSTCIDSLWWEKVAVKPVTSQSNDSPIHWFPLRIVLPIIKQPNNAGLGIIIICLRWGICCKEKQHFVTKIWKNTDYYLYVITLQRLCLRTENRIPNTSKNGFS